MKLVSDPIGTGNDVWLLEVAAEASIVVAAWGGTHGGYLYRGAKVKQMFREAGITLRVLRVTKSGHPEHPLYLPGYLNPVHL